MSWEMDALIENAKDLAEYKRRVIEDYVKSCDKENYPVSYSDCISHLISRMYHEGLPAEEPRSLVVTGVYKESSNGK
jgi:cytoplasmic iron level regulating protein YaaA (DUF328/UPF0246 family)